MAIPGEQADGFANNWAYLKTELQWLERLLLLAVARQKKDTKEIDRFSQSSADRATSHWWKGLIALDGNIAYDEHRQPQTGTKSTYQQQLEGQIQASQRRGIVLALPALRDRLRLKEAEKNLVLMALAPEVNRRYAQLYRFLQGNEGMIKPDLPTLDLVLRLLCRTDSEWHSFRNHLLTASPLLKAELIQFLPCPEQTRLSSPVKLSDRLINYLLADQPAPADLEALLHLGGNFGGQKPLAAPVAVISRCVYLQRKSASTTWSDLILPPNCLSSLQSLSQQVAGQLEAGEQWIDAQLPQKGKMLLLAGKPGTGKTTAAAALAQAIDAPLFTVDLAQIDSANHGAVIKEISLHAPTVLLIKSAQIWLNRSATLSTALIHQFFKERSKLAGITCFSVTHQASVQLQWQRQMDAVFTLPIPEAVDRLKLWQRAFPPQVSISEQIPWQVLANQLPISGGTIQEIVHDALCCAAAAGASTIEVTHLLTVCQQRGYKLKLPAVLLKPKSKRKSDRKTPSVSMAPAGDSAELSKVQSEELLEVSPVGSLEASAEISPETASAIPPGKARNPSATAKRKRTKES